jgi:hypothetical protein
VIQHDNAAPWIEELEWESALRAKENIERRRKGIAAKYRCDADASGRNGHGRRRVLETSERMTVKRANQQKDFNNNRARHIVDTAIRWKCGRIEMENLSEVPKPETLVLGAWNYFQLNERVKLLCGQHGMEFQLEKPREVLEEEKRKELENGKDEEAGQNEKGTGRTRGTTGRGKGGVRKNRRKAG